MFNENNSTIINVNLLLNQFNVIESIFYSAGYLIKKIECKFNSYSSKLQ